MTCATPQADNNIAANTANSICFINPSCFFASNITDDTKMISIDKLGGENRYISHIPLATLDSLEKIVPQCEHRVPQCQVLFYCDPKSMHYPAHPHPTPTPLKITPPRNTKRPRIPIQEHGAYITHKPAIRSKHPQSPENPHINIMGHVNPGRCAVHIFIIPPKHVIDYAVATASRAGVA